MTLSTRLAAGGVIMNTLWIGVYKLRYLLILVSLGGIVFGALNAPDFFDRTQDELDAKRDQHSRIAEELLNTYNLWSPNRNTPGRTMLVVHAKRHGDSVLRDDVVKDAFAALRAADLCFCGSSLTSECYYADLWSLRSANLTAQAEMFVSADERTTVMALQCWDFFLPDEINSGVSEYNPDPDRFYAAATSQGIIDHSNSDAAKEDLARSDAISIPIALLVLAYRVQSVPLLIIPVLALPTSLLVSFGIMSLMAGEVDPMTGEVPGTAFPSFSPALFISTALAMGFDWALFQLTRWNEAVQAKIPNKEAVQESFVFAGRTVVVSGVTLIVCYLCFLFFDVEFLSSVGKGAAITLSISLIVSLTLTPALLLIIPQGFWTYDVFASCRRYWNNRNATGEPGEPGNEPLLSDSPTTNMHTNDLGTRSDPGALSAKQRASIWYRWVRVVSRRPGLVFVGGMLAALPFLIVAIMSADINMDQNQLHPRNKEVFHAWDRFTSDLHGSPIVGYAFPYALVTEVHNGNAKSQALFDTQNRLLSELPDLPDQGIVGPSFCNARPVSVNESLRILSDTPTPDWPASDLLYYRRVQRMVPTSWTSPNFFPPPNVIVTELDVTFDGQGMHSTDWIKAARRVADRYSTDDVSFYIALGLSQMYDVVNGVYDVFVSLVVIMIVTLSAIVGVATYHSALHVLRIAVSIMYTLGVTVGVGTLIFGSFFWMGPVLTVPIIVGLALDYDVFLVSRTLEYRRNNYSSRASIALAFWRTGGIVTTAGIIMVLAFGSLVLSSQELLQQAGFLLGFSVLLDTFVVRSVIVPSLLFLLDERAWWPASYGEPKLSATDADLDLDL